MDIIIWGIGGKMGAMLTAAAAARGIRVVCGVDKFSTGCVNIKIYPSQDKITERADAVIDFSRPDALADTLAYCLRTVTPLVLCTTGYSAAQENEIKTASKKIPIFKSANMSVGINLISAWLKQAAKTLPEGYDIEIIEKHHNQKVDAPSGTALLLADAVNSALPVKKSVVTGRNGASAQRGSEIGVHAVRGGNIVGDHIVQFIGKEEIITIEHNALSRSVFAEGALNAAKFLCGKNPSLYNMNDLIDG